MILHAFWQTFVISIETRNVSRQLNPLFIKSIPSFEAKHLLIELHLLIYDFVFVFLEIVTSEVAPGRQLTDIIKISCEFYSGESWDICDHHIGYDASILRQAFF